MLLTNNGEYIVEDKNYYRQVLIKPKNIDKYYSLAVILSFSNNIYKFTTKVYKIVSFRNEIALDYIYKLLLSKFSPDIIDIILEFYLQNNVSFNSITADGYNTIKQNTIKIVSNIRYSTQLNKYQTIIDYPSNENAKKYFIYQLVSNISNNFLDLLNQGISFEINSIFSISTNNIELCNIYKITNSGIGWGIYML